jgi:hypothetical protein
MLRAHRDRSDRHSAVRLLGNKGPARKIGCVILVHQTEQSLRRSGASGGAGKREHCDGEIFHGVTIPRNTGILKNTRNAFMLKAITWCRKLAAPSYASEAST